MKKFVVVLVVVLTIMSLVMAQAEEAAKISLGNDVLKKDVTGKTQELMRLDAEAKSRLDVKIVIMPRVRNCVTVGQARFHDTDEVEEQNWFLNALDWVTFWD